MKKSFLISIVGALFFTNAMAASLNCSYKFDGDNRVVLGYYDKYSSEYGRGQMNGVQNGEYKGRGVSTMAPFVYHENYKSGQKSSFSTFYVSVNPGMSRDGLLPLTAWSLVEFNSVKPNKVSVRTDFMNKYTLDLAKKTIKIVDPNSGKVLADNVAVSCLLQ